MNLVPVLEHKEAWAEAFAARFNDRQRAADVGRFIKEFGAKRSRIGRGSSYETAAVQQALLKYMPNEEARDGN
jgi:hypothetical protein